ncbi:putative Beta-glucosidase [Quillaja saponaria]|uniref:Beta-glucosidase n=1 Tax=Quillaja saponaria TaxID=32244 RepID=A0AAD7Q9Z2_QUISA|nr:putative Beta-glucosidase [Quillaja saponaria]
MAEDLSIQREFNHMLLFIIMIFPNHLRMSMEDGLAVTSCYDSGFVPPQRCSLPFGEMNCSKGNSVSEPYLVVHHVLLAHASSEKQHGVFGLSVYTMGFTPETDTEEDIIATQRAHDFYGYGSFVIWRLSQNYEDKCGLKNSILHKSGIQTDETKRHRCRHCSKDNLYVPFAMFQRIYFQTLSMLPPLGFARNPGKIQATIWQPPIYIYENGQRTKRNSSLEDVSRLKYLHGNMGGVLDAMRNGSNTRGFFQWSFLDVFELLDGYASSYGLYYVDLDDPDLKRYPKLSAHWYSSFLKGRRTSGVGHTELEKNFSALSVSHSFQ